MSTHLWFSQETARKDARIWFLGAGDAGLDDGAKIAAYFAGHRTRILTCFHIAAIGMMAFVCWCWRRSSDRIQE